LYSFNTLLRLRRSYFLIFIDRLNSLFFPSLLLPLPSSTGWAAAATDKMAKESSASALSASSDNWLPRGGEGDDDDNPAMKSQLQPPQPTIGGGAGAATVTADYSSDFEMTPSEVRVAAGTSAYLSCRPRSLRNKTVRPLLSIHCQHRIIISSRL
jgi:hypothetical protein